MKRLARLLRIVADRIDYEGAPKIMSWSFTFELYEGVRFRQDGRGCPRPASASGRAPHLCASNSRHAAQ